MKQKILIFFLLSVFHFGYSQVSPKPKLEKQTVNDTNQFNSINDSLSTRANRSSSNIKKEEEEAKIQDYLIISHKRDTVYVDTTLTIKKEYKFNYLRKDNFELLPFSNVGQTYNRLAYSFNSDKLMPSFGARARHFNYMEIEDINYYRVPTPFTELYYKTAFSQGQQVDAFFTVNTSPQLNMSIAYKGLRSLGKYQHILTSTGNFRFTTSYNTKNKRYIANAHFVAQDLLNEENGGITDDNIIYFETGDSEFKDRGVFEVNFEDAESMLKGKRFHLDHQYNIIQPKDSVTSNALSIGHIISFEDKFFQFDQDDETDYFGESFRSSDLSKRVTLENFYNQLNLKYTNKTIGALQFNVSHNDYNYGYDNVLVLNQNSITNRLKGQILALGGAYSKSFNKLKLQAEVGANISGDFNGDFLTAQAAYSINNEAVISAKINTNSKAPNYNFQLYQNDYINYNWANNFNNTNTQEVEIALQSNKIANISMSFSNIDDYTYFKSNATDSLIKPYQNSQTINYFKLKVEKEIKYKKLGLHNTILYQNVKDNNNTLNVPQLVTRNTLYYTNHFFNKELFLQTGITFSYFSKYYMNGYDPVLAELYVQDQKEYGAFPRFDFFINAKIRQARIYLKAEHFNSAWTGYDYYSAPNYPYRDFTVRFGVVWNFFL
ncbi:putative porin [Lacinutrix sp. C3R15]|uniref:putative porin n=1 Tax=Flavobacteriaceae TaxID=49546 RepID=UPI001C084729|nr:MULTISPECIES: putative porin [Flavobacteriaceae]MBU2939431.1 putative porin [Lacinutrix sp. C3R15]MDO6622746.1 putative porin [Oceanihabitans sp. 1_MG-2023]